jgi:site-specific recombinase XerD
MEQTEKIKRWQIVTKAQTHLAKTKLSYDTRKKHRLNWQRFHDFCLQENVECDFGDVLSLEVAFNQFLMKTSIQEAATLRSIEYSIKLLKEFILKGTMREPRQSFNFTSPIGQKALEYISEKETEHIRPSSLNTYKMQLSRFIDFLTTQKITRIDQLCKEHVFMYIRQLKSGFKADTYLAISFAKRFLKWLYENKWLKTNISVKIPSGKFVQQPNLPSVYSREEVTKLLESVDRSNPVGKRDYLILLLASHLGMRASDIANLQFSNLCWEENLIKFVQVKTGVPVELPLLPKIGNAIIDYLKYGRAESTLPNVLLKTFVPYEAFHVTSIYSVISKYFKQAGIDTTGRRHGAHSLRHSLASRMLEGQTVMPVISEVLGHTDTDSTMFYLRVDVSSLDVCPLDVPPVNKMFYNQFSW